MKASLDQSPSLSASLTKSTPLINKLLWVFMLAMVLANISGFMYSSLLPLYLKELDASVVQVGLFFTLSQIVPLALQILGGWISDSLGRLRSIALGSIAGVLSYVGLILAPTWHWVLLGEGFGAITRSLVAPSFNAFIAEQSSEKNRARVFGITETIFHFVAVVGPPLGGYLANLYGFKFMLFCAAVLYTLATILRIGMAQFAARGNEAQPQKLSLGGLKLNLGSMLGMVLAGGLITWVLVTDGVRDVAYSLSFDLLPLYLEDQGGLNIQQIGLLESIFGIFLMITSVPAGLLADKYGERLGIASGFVMHFIAMMVFIRVSAFFGFACAWALFGMGVGLLSPAYNALISKAVPEKLRGTAFGLFSTSLGVISLPAPIIGAQLWSQREPRLPFMITGWLSLLAIAPVWLKFKTPSNGEVTE
jgi:MFS family permease